MYSLSYQDTNKTLSMYRHDDNKEQGFLLMVKAVYMEYTTAALYSSNDQEYL